MSSSAAPADTADCIAAARFLRDDRRMAAVVERDTIDDWRTGKRVAGCRITAAGSSDIGVAREAVRFYERLRAAEWTRTPDPADAPSEASMRFRKSGSDCLFNVNGLALLNTAAEATVSEAVQPRAGESRYYLFVMCMPAMPAMQNGTR